MIALSKSLPRPVQLQAIGVFTLTMLVGALVAWKSVEVLLVTVALFSTLALCKLWIQSFRKVLYACLVAAVGLPAIYPNVLGGEVPVYACNFVLLVGGMAFLLRCYEFRITSDNINQASWLFLGALLTSVPFSYWISGTGAARESLLRFILILQPFLVYFWVRFSFCCDQDSHLHRLIQLLLWIGAAAALYGIIDFYFPIPLEHPFADQYIYLEQGRVRRAQGVFYEASSFGNLCAFLLCLTVVLQFARGKTSLIKRIFLVMGSGIFTVAIFLSYSRGSWLTVLVTLVVFLLLQGMLRVQVVALLTLLLGGFIGLVYQLSPEVVTNFFSWRIGNLAELWSSPNLATSGRWENWALLIHFFSEHPWFLLFGIGYKTIHLTSLFGQPVVADNGYLSILFENGVLGLAAFLWLNFSILRVLHTNRSVTRLQQLCQVFLLAFWCGELIQMFTGDIFTYWRNLIVYFAVIAAVQTVTRPAPSRDVTPALF